MTKFCQLWLTCRDTIEADTIAKTLLEARLVACVKRVAVDSDYRWQNGLDHDNEVLLIMDSREDLFNVIEKQISALHSYTIFNLQAIPIARISKKADNWFKESLVQEK